VCVKCAGVQAEWKVAQGFFTSLGLSLADLQTMVRQAQGRPRRSEPLHCTACEKGAMHPLVHKGVELDLCEHCGAAWFDRGELGRLSAGKLGAGLKEGQVAGESSRSVGVFEMFWDCQYCDTKALLGKSNRFCPNCGAQQAAEARYFPPPGQEVAANTEYDGADKACPACQTPNGAKAHNCRNCGSPLDGAGEVGRVADRSSGAPKGPAKAAPASAPAKGKSKWPWVVGGAVLVAISCCLVSMFWTKNEQLTVVRHEWERTIDVETMKAVSDSAWCDSMPGGAYAVSRSREQRSTKRIPDGETCTTRDVDRGDGTFERKQDCRPKYREEPVYDDKCSFTIDRWVKARTEKAAGQGVSPEPRWPEVRLSRTGSMLGAEREGARTETYRLVLKGKDGKQHDCRVPAAKWAQVKDGLSKEIPVTVIGGIPECDKL
jgi:hypothetical protein